MAILSKGKTFEATDQILTSDIHQLVDSATFASGAVDNSSTAIDGSGRLVVKDGGISTAKIGTDAVTPAKVDEDNDTAFVMKRIRATVSQSAAYSEAVTTGTWAPDLNNGNFQIVTVGTTDVTAISALANMQSGQQFTFIIINNGGFTLDGAATWASTWKFQGGDKPSGTSAAGSIDIISGVTDGTNAYITMIKNLS